MPVWVSLNPLVQAAWKKGQAGQTTLLWTLNDLVAVVIVRSEPSPDSYILEIISDDGLKTYLDQRALTASRRRLCLDPPPCCRR